MARPRWLECHAPVDLTVGTIRNLRRAAEVEIRVPRLADRPAAVTLLKVEKLLWSRGLLGFADLLGHVHPAAHLELGFLEARLMQRVLQALSIASPRRVIRHSASSMSVMSSVASSAAT